MRKAKASPPTRTKRIHVDNRSRPSALGLDSPPRRRVTASTRVVTRIDDVAQISTRRRLT
jgi:hypothetical protein